MLQKSRSYSEVYNDLDGEVVNLFRVVRDCGRDLLDVLRMTPFSRDEFNLSYNTSVDPIEQARRTVIRSFMGFASGLQSHQRTGFRSCSNRSGTTPARDWVNYPDALEGIIERLQGVVIENRDALDVISQHDTPDTLHYIDPPYVLNTRFKGQSTRIYAEEMMDQDHENLCQAIQGLQGAVVVSGYDNEIYNDLLTGWHKYYRKAFADGAKARMEVLWTNRMKPNLQTAIAL
ncbi:putative methyltransferase [Robiginitalea biformata HTCC2501]|uniref:Putative methyltransferase n=1 Tax=Robiginitalea biformata (strain ATCC BAA-864 / DSM 15991 / KCTC 12146 / HTCC2501) TaxID=313596 RepID=A4CPV5_ROBBH|nr:putative methyltransferase [Robiginitalea biformata HTCC2501]